MHKYFITLIILTIFPLYSAVILKYPKVSDIDGYEGVSVGGLYYPKFTYHFITLTNELNAQTVAILEEAESERKLREAESLIAYLDKHQDPFVFTDKERKFIIDWSQIDKESPEEKEKKQEEGLTLDITKLVPAGANRPPVQLHIRGQFDLTMGYGWEKRIYLSDEFLESVSLTNEGEESASQFPWDEPPGSLVQDGFDMKQSLAVNLVGSIANSLSVTIDHRTSRQENTVVIEYKPSPEKEKLKPKAKRSIVRNVKAGNVALNLGGRSQFVSIGGIDRDAYGIRADLEKEELLTSRDSLKGNVILSFSQGITKTKVFDGNSQVGAITNYSGRFIPQRFYFVGRTSLVDVEIYRKTENISDSELELVNASTGEVVSFERLPSSIVDIDKTHGIIDIRRPHGNKSVIVFFTYLENGVIKGMPLTNEYYSTIDFPYNRATINPTNAYTTLTNHLIRRGGIYPTDKRYQNFVVLYDENENAVNPWEMRNRYAIPRGIDEDSIEVRLYLQDGSEKYPDDIQGSVGFFDGTGQYEIDSDSALLSFVEFKPFAGELSNEEIYSLGNSILDQEIGNRRRRDIASKYYVEIRYKKTFTDFPLDFNVMPGSEIVRRNGHVVPRDEYTLDHMSGRIRFKDPTYVSAGDTIEISYEHKAFGGAMQNILAGGRLDYKIAEGNEIGTSFLYSRGQEPATAPAPDMAPSSRFIFDVDGVFDVMRLFKVENSPFSLSLSGEFAYSWQDLNTMDLGLIFDMDGDEQSLYFRKVEDKGTYLSRNPSLEDKFLLGLGKLSFIDFHEYSAGGSQKEWLPFTYSVQESLLETNPEQFKSFETKSGPYVVLGEGSYDRALYPNQNSMIFDYEFEPEKGASYISVVQGFNREGGVDASMFTELEIVAKLMRQSPNDDDPKKVLLLVELGEPTEDFDGDGVQDRENNKYDTSGLDFNYEYITGSNEVVARNTRLGRGSYGETATSISTHNYYLDSEDLDGDEHFSYHEMTIGFPSTNTVSALPPSGIFAIPIPSHEEFLAHPQWYSNETFFYELIEMPSTLTNSEADAIRTTPYVKIRMRIRPNMSEAVSNILMRSKAMRLTLIHGNMDTVTPSTETSPNKGRLILDRMRFVTSKWANVVLDGLTPTSSEQFGVTILNSRMDESYKHGTGHRLIDDVELEKNYTDLHGSVNPQDLSKLSDSVLEINYNLNNRQYAGFGSDGRYGEVSIYNRGTSRTYDLSMYRYLNLFVFREKWSEYSALDSESLIFKFGKDENNYYEISIPVAFLDKDETGIVEGSDNTDVTTRWNKVSIDLTREDNSELGQTNIFTVNINDGNSPKTLSTIGVTNKVRVKVKGIPTLTEVRYYTIGVSSLYCGEGETASGTIWVNDLYASESETAKGWAWRMNTKAGYNKSVNIGSFPVFSGLSAEYSHQDRREDFGSIGESRKKDENLSDTLGFSGSFLKFFKSYMGLTWTENLTPTNERIQPKISQYYNLGRSRNMSLVLDHGIRFLPSLSHTYAQNTSKNFYVTKVENPTNENAVVLKKDDTQTRTFSIRQSYRTAQLFGIPKVSFGQSYDISSTIQRTIRQAKSNISIDDIDFGRGDERKSLIISNFYDDENDYNPALKQNEIVNMDDLVYDASYGISHSKRLGADFGFPFVGISADAEHRISYSTPYDKNIATNISALYEQNYFEQIPLLFQDMIVDETVNEIFVITNTNIYETFTNYDSDGHEIVTRIYETNISTNTYRVRSKKQSDVYKMYQQVNIRKTKFIEDIGFSFQEEYTESGYLYDIPLTYTLLEGKYTNTDEFIDNLTNYNYTEENDYKDISAKISGNFKMNLNFRSLWKKSPLIAIPINYGRTFEFSEQAVPNHLFVYNGGKEVYNFNLSHYISQTFPVFFKPPWYYINPPLADGIRKIADRTEEGSLRLEDASFNENHRHNAADAVSEIGMSLDPNTGRYFLPYINDSYSSRVRMIEQYNLSFQLMDIPVWDVFLPTRFSYRMVLTTERDASGSISQEDSLTFNTGTPIKIPTLIRLFNKEGQIPGFWNRFNASYNFSYRLKNAYKEKTREENYGFNVNTGFVISQRIPFRITFGFQDKRTTQYLRFDSTNSDYRYMGIGRYGEVTNEDGDIVSNYLIYNVGSYEYHADQVTVDDQIASIIPSISEKSINAKIQFELPSEVRRIVKKLKEPFTFSHAISLEMDTFRWFDYDDTVIYYVINPDYTGETNSTNAMANEILRPMTARTNFAENLLNATKDTQENFLRFEVKYSTSFNIKKNITLRLSAQTPIQFFYYYGGLGKNEDETKEERITRVLDEYENYRKYDVSAGFEIGGSMIIKF